MTYLPQGKNIGDNFKYYVNVHKLTMSIMKIVKENWVLLAVIVVVILVLIFVNKNKKERHPMFVGGSCGTVSPNSRCTCCSNKPNDAWCKSNPCKMTEQFKIQKKQNKKPAKKSAKKSAGGKKSAGSKIAMGGAGMAAGLGAGMAAGGDTSGDTSDDTSGDMGSNDGSGSEVAAPSGGSGQQDPAYDWTENEPQDPMVTTSGGFKSITMPDGRVLKFKDPQIGAKLKAANFNVQTWAKDKMAKYGEDGLTPDAQAWWAKYGPGINWNDTQFDMPGSGRTLAGMYAENQKVYDAKVAAGWKPDYGPGDAGKPAWETDTGVQATTPFSAGGADSELEIREIDDRYFTI
ncbi:hypothetical protein ATCVTN60342_719R [Acanthocystis turfacea Chlorella virus TN603.4.2]|nr:hypothetical protein ATCVTN60342_719R [Acanthocystis turfacea Chlorella virus TN603.4.2]